MSDFHQTLLLIYLNEFEDNYLFTEMKQLCNFSTSQLNNCLQILKEKEYIHFNEVKNLAISPKGKLYLESKGLDNVLIDDLFQEKTTLQFGPKIGFNDIYIPEKF